jgi:hypothetical protein
VRPCPPCTCGSVCTSSCGVGYRPLRVDVGYPLLAVTGYRVAGVDVPEAEWPRVDGGDSIVLQSVDGAPGFWPAQDLARPAGAAETWEVQVEYGAVPPLFVLEAVAAMVSEQVKGCVKPEECGLPDNVESVTERGRTFRFRTPGDTNSGVWAWDEMCKAFPAAKSGAESFRLPGRTLIGGPVVSAP